MVLREPAPNKLLLTWLPPKRGCIIVPLDRASPPFTAGSGTQRVVTLRFDSSDDDPLGTHIVWGAKAKPSAPAYQPPGGFAVNARVARKCVMSGRINWRGLASRNRMRRQGVEDVKGKMPLVDQPPKQPRRKVSKAELREQAAAAFLAWRAGQTSKDK